MNIVRFSRGDFFGTIIPGGFLLMNICGLAYPFVQKLPEVSSPIVLPAVFVASYVIGISLRAVSPDDVEKIARFVVVPLLLCRSLCSGKKSFMSLFREKGEPFPYRTTFWKYLKRAPRSFREFYSQVRKDEFGKKYSGIKGHQFINQCKLLVYQHSGPLRDELIFSEGMVRFLSGMFLGLLVSTSLLVVAVIASPIGWRVYGALFVGYFVIMEVFGDKLRRMRLHEVYAILDSFALVMCELKRTTFLATEAPAKGVKDDLICD